jgi:small subunit ribosomal protein S35
VIILDLKPRYNEETGLVTLTADRCPYRGQNRDYAGYLLTALFHESLREEDWEEKGTEDLEHFPAGERGEGRQALEAILNSGEDEAAVARYTEEVSRLLGLPEATVEAEVVGGQ